MDMLLIILMVNKSIGTFYEKRKLQKQKKQTKKSKIN